MPSSFVTEVTMEGCSDALALLQRGHDPGVVNNVLFNWIIHAMARRDKAPPILMWCRAVQQMWAPNEMLCFEGWDRPRTVYEILLTMGDADLWPDRHNAFAVLHKMMSRRAEVKSYQRRLVDLFKSVYESRECKRPPEFRITIDRRGMLHSCHATLN